MDDDEIILEGMSEFFAARVVGYDEHMLGEVEGCREAYERLTELFSLGASTLLDLGAGTGLELSGIMKKCPQIKVAAIDLCKEMLDKLKSKPFAANVTAIVGDYFTVPFGKEKFDCAVSFESLHHFTFEQKVGLYKKIYDSLAQKGTFFDCDYMADTEETEKEISEFAAGLKRRQKVESGKYVHIDTPLCVDNEIKALLQAGFCSAQEVFRQENTTIVVAKK